jgi:hypothetical protein
MKSEIQRALVVGIDSYPSAPLDGCVNDAKAWSRLLRRGGVDVQLLTNGAATTDRLRQSIRKITMSSVPFAIIYSGHGSQVIDEIDGDEGDRLDECICPVDFDGGREHAIVDDEFRRWLGNVRSHCLLVIDACHSGTAISSMSRGCGYGAPNPSCIKGWPGRAFTPSSYGERSTFLSVLEDNPMVALMAACKDDQVALEGAVPRWELLPYWKRSGGLWSYYLTQTVRWLDRTAPDYMLTVERWFKAASAMLTSDYPGQNPQLTTSAPSGWTPFWDG